MDTRNFRGVFIFPRNLGSDFSTRIVNVLEVTGALGMVYARVFLSWRDTFFIYGIEGGEVSENYFQMLFLLRVSYRSSFCYGKEPFCYSESCEYRQLLFQYFILASSVYSAIREIFN